jgi:hypothetical protein
MTHLPHITFNLDWPLAIVVCGTVLLALAVNLGTPAGWLRRRP